MIGPTDLLHPSPAPHFKTFQVFLIYCTNRPSYILSHNEYGGRRYLRNIQHINCITYKKILTFTCNRNISTAHSQTPFLYMYFLWLITQGTLWKTALYTITAATLIDVLYFQCMFHKADACCTRNKQISTSPSRFTPAALMRGVIWCTDWTNSVLQTT